MKVRLSARSHNPADRLVPRFDFMIPVGGPVIEVEVTEEQAAHLAADPWVKMEPAGRGKPEKTEDGQ